MSLFKHHLTSNIKIEKNQMQNFNFLLKVLHYARCRNPYKISQVLQNNFYFRGGTVLIEEEEKKIGLREALKRDDRYGYSKVSEILAKIHSKNGEMRLFKMEEVEKWM